MSRNFKYSGVTETDRRRYRDTLNYNYESMVTSAIAIRSLTRALDRAVTAMAPRVVIIHLAQVISGQMWHFHYYDWHIVSNDIHRNWMVDLTWREIGLTIGMVDDLTDKQIFAETVESLWGK